MVCREAGPSSVLNEGIHTCGVGRTWQALGILCRLVSRCGASLEEQPAVGRLRTTTSFPGAFSVPCPVPISTFPCVCVSGELSTVGSLVCFAGAPYLDRASP